MGIQAITVFAGLAIALAVAVFASLLDVGAPLLGWFAIALVPVLWTLLHLTERVIGREIWHYTAPYPYRAMRAAAVGNAPHLKRAGA